MKKTIFMLILVTAFSCAKKETVTDKTLGNETAYTTPPREKYNKATEKKSENLAGTYTIIWKWLPETPGKIDLKPSAANEYSAEAEYEAYGSTFSLRGNFKENSEKNLEFDGVIKTFQDGRNGYSCTRTEKAVFKLSADGKSWRYSYLDCKASTDYIDIFK